MLNVILNNALCLCSKVFKSAASREGPQQCANDAARCFESDAKIGPVTPIVDNLINSSGLIAVLAHTTARALSLGSLCGSERSVSQYTRDGEEKMLE